MTLELSSLMKQQPIFGGSLPLPKDGFYSPLRYPGGKAKLTDYVSELIALNKIEHVHYVEPFCGGAGIGLSMLARGLIEHLHINDVDRSIYAFWHSAKNHNQELCHLIMKTKVSIPCWLEQRKIQANSDNVNLLKLGFSTFYLNRTNRSGIMTGGVIGGADQKGKWKINTRYNKEALIKRIQLIGQLANKITITNEDASIYIDNNLQYLPKETFVYFDPPYFAQGPNLYLNAYLANDHKSLAKKIQSNVTHPWIVSYDNVADISDLYSTRRQQSFSLNYSAQVHYKGSELMIFKDGIKMPSSVYVGRHRL